MQDDIQKIEAEITALRDSLLKAQKAYYVDSAPVMTDMEYDRLFDHLVELEKQYPQFNDPGSPTVRVGSDIDNTLPEKEHYIPVLSLDKCYNTDDLLKWTEKLSDKVTGDIEITIEPKIDGAGVVLYYDKGMLESVVTRGNGYIGNDITENVKTIRSVPLRIDYTKKLAVRGEIFIEKAEFIDFNNKHAEGKYANPRNLASGSVRRQKSKETALYPLRIFIYEGFFEKPFNNHIDIMIKLKELGFPLNDHIGFFKNDMDLFHNLPFNHAFSGKPDRIPEYIANIKKIRHDLPYEIDGMVVKLNDIKQRDALGYTQHHPRWAIAYKFDAPLAETVVESIIVQIGRGGRATPVANLEPVKLAGSTIARATLHNQEYINTLGLNVGDRVTISKRGDVIPAVEEVVEKGEHVSAFIMDNACPICETPLTNEGAHLFCLNDECPARLSGTLQFFVARGQMDIESLGDKTIEFLFDKGFVKHISDIYTFDYYQLLSFEGYKEKKITNIRTSVEKSKQNGFITVLASLGLKDIGKKAAELLVKKYGTIDAILKVAADENLDDLQSIDGIGEGIAKSVITHFKNPKVIELITDLKESGLNFTYEQEVKEEHDLFLEETKWVITGSFENFKPRDKAGVIIKQHGGEVLSSISSKTTHLLCGEKAGSKLAKAEKVGAAIVHEDDFLKIIENKSL